MLSEENLGPDNLFASGVGGDWISQGTTKHNVG